MTKVMAQAGACIVNCGQAVGIEHEIEINAVLRCPLAGRRCTSRYTQCDVRLCRVQRSDMQMHPALERAERDPVDHAVR